MQLPVLLRSLRQTQPRVLGPIFPKSQSLPGTCPLHLRRGMDRAIVIGSGIGGLATAQVLSKHFSVLLLERDAWSPSAADTSVVTWWKGQKARPGVYQVGCRAWQCNNAAILRASPTTCAAAVDSCPIPSSSAIAVQPTPCAASQGK